MTRYSQELVIQQYKEQQTQIVEDDLLLSLLMSEKTGKTSEAEKISF